MDFRTIRAAVVTGPTGAVGVALCERLLREGVRVYAAVRPDSLRRRALPTDDGLTLVDCDLSDLPRLPAMIPGGRADAFFHLAWTGTTGAARNDASLQLDNVRHAVDAVRAASALGSRVFVGAGSQAEYGRPGVPLTPETPAFPETGYGIAKLCAGSMTRLECAKLGLDHVWPRILSVYGPHDGMNSMISATIRALLRGESPALTEGVQLWDYLYADDAAEALLLCATRGRNGAVYPLGGGAARPLREYVEAIRNAIDPGLPLNFGAVPYGPGQLMRLEADLTALRRDTGFQPSTPFDKGIQKTIDWMRAEP